MPGFLSKLDRFTVGLVVSVSAGILIPCSGVWDTVFSRLSDAAIILLFFLYGAKLSRRSVWEGLMHWRLQSLVAASTFVIFPLLGILSIPMWNAVLGPDLCMGMLYVCMLPSTVQSSIAFTSMAGGNVAAAICSASVSSLLGVFLTPLLVGLVWSRGGADGVDFSTFLNICYIILVPFVAGQIAQRWIGKWVVAHRNVTSWTDHSTIWLVIYTAFSHAMVNGVWKNLPWLSLVEVLGLSSAGRRPLADGFSFPQAPFFAGRPDCDHLLRFQEKPGYRHPDDERDFCRFPHRPAGHPDHDFPPAPVDGLFHPGPEVGQGPGGEEGRFPVGMESRVAGYGDAGSLFSGRKKLFQAVFRQPCTWKSARHDPWLPEHEREKSIWSHIGREACRKREPPGSRHFRPEREFMSIPGQAKNTVILDVPARNDGVASPFRDFCRYGPVAEFVHEAMEGFHVLRDDPDFRICGIGLHFRNIHPEGPHSVAVRSVEFQGPFLGMGVHEEQEEHDAQRHQGDGGHRKILSEWSDMHVFFSFLWQGYGF